MLAITQHLDDFDNEHGRPLLRSANMKLFFQQSVEELRYVQDTLGLSDNEVRLISRLKTAKGRYSRAYWINGPRGRGEVSSASAASSTGSRPATPTTRSAAQRSPATPTTHGRRSNGSHTETRG